MAAKKERTAKQLAADKRRSKSMKGKPPPHIGEHHVAKKHTHHKPDGDGQPFAHTGSGGLAVRLPTYVERKYVEARLGAIWQGFFMEMMRPIAIDMSAYYPPITNEKELAEWNRYADERELGKELFNSLGYGYLHAVKDGNPSVWNMGLQRALQIVRQANGGLMSGSTSGGFSRPLDEATVITGPFGSNRNGSLHRGVDLRAAIGSNVHAPTNARVDGIWTEQEGGLCLRLALQRPDGGYADDTSMGDDSGLLVTFAHLNDTVASKGDLVSPGQIVAHSGNSGDKTSGPHLHIAAEYFNDAPLWSFDANSRVFIDPVALYGGEQAIDGLGAPVPFKGGDVVAGLLVPRQDAANFTPLPEPMDLLSSIAGGTLQLPGASSEKPVTLTINNSGAMTVNGGTAVNTPIKAVLDVGGIQGGQGEGGYDNAPIPDAIRATAQQAVRIPGVSIVQGIGGLAGQWFARTVSPEGMVSLAKLATSGAGALGSLAGAAGTLATTVAPWLNAIPYVGPYLSAVAAVGGPIASFAGPAVSTAAGIAGQLLGLAQPQGAPPQPPSADTLLRMFAGMGQDTVGPPPNPAWMKP